jgi:DNA-binding MarR family transcriptional regulator
MILKQDDAVHKPNDKSRLRLWLKLLKSSNLIEDQLRRFFRDKHGTTLPRFDVMAALSRYPSGLKMSEISGLLRVSNGNVTGIVDRLNSEGLVQRVSVLGDRRAHLVILTIEGEKTFEHLVGEHTAWINEKLGGISIEKIKGFIKRLDDLNETLEDKK